MKDSNEKSRIQKFRQKLDSRRKKKKKKRSQLSPKEYDIRRDFENAIGSGEDREGGADANDFILTPEKLEEDQSNASPFRILLIVSFVFFLIAGGLAGAMIWSGSNTVSTKNVEFVLKSPATVSGGEKTVIQVSVTNRNQIALREPSFSVVFPKDTRDPENLKEAVEKRQIELETVQPGETIQREIPVVFFGNKGTKKEMKASLQYALENSNAIFVKDTAKRITLGSSLVANQVKIFRESPSDQDIELELTLDSNSTKTIENLILEAEFPTDFVFKAASPTPFAGNTIWHFDSLEPGEEKKVKISGRITGFETENKIFRFQAGVSDGESNGVGVPYNITEAETAIEPPFASVDINITGSQKGAALNPTDTINSAINWKNNSGSTLTNLEILLSVEGSLVDRTTLTSRGGFYNSENDTIIWNTRTEDNYDVIPAGDSGTVGFDFQFFPPFSENVQNINNPEVMMNVTVRAQRISESGVSEELEAYVSEEAKVNTQTRFSAQLTHGNSPFESSGPVPPKVGSETTYTVFWRIENSLNAVEGGKVTAVLPPYIEWKGEHTPRAENVSYNASTGEVTWRLGDIAASPVGRTMNSREVAFQIGLRPSLSQLGDAPVLLSRAIFEGMDLFTGAALREEVGALTSEENSEVTR